MTIDHLGIAVKSLELAIPTYEKLLGTKCYKTETVESENVTTAFFKVGDSKIELLQSLDENGVISRFIEKKGEGLHHIAYAVDDIFQSIQELKNQGFTLINEEPKPGADNKIISFLHPKDTNGVLVELCQERIQIK